MSKPKLQLQKGLPASGKSTDAKDLINKGWKRVNKDLLREMVDNGVWSRKNEGVILGAEKILVKELLRQGFNVVVDDCNFAHEETWKRVAEEMDADFEIKFFDVPVLECVERDSKRGEKSVGAKVIFGMYNQYLKPHPPERNELLPNCYIFDIDGTLAKMVDRSPYDTTKVLSDTENTPVARLFRVIKDDRMCPTKLLIVSGRMDDCKKETEQWLMENEILADDLFMRPHGDVRNDAVIKKEIYEKYIKGKYNVLAVFDDRDRVVAMWRSLGIPCFQVDYGNF